MEQITAFPDSEWKEAQRKEIALLQERQILKPVTGGSLLLEPDEHCIDTTSSFVQQDTVAFKQQENKWTQEDQRNEYEIEWDLHQKVESTQSRIKSRYGLPEILIDEGVERSDPLQRHKFDTMLRDDYYLVSCNEQQQESRRANIAAVNLNRNYRSEGGSSPHSRKLGLSMLRAFKSTTRRRRLSDTPIVIDTGCSHSVTPYREDFTSAIKKSKIQEMTGLTESTKVEGQGWVEWPIRDVFGQIETIQTKAYLLHTKSNNKAQQSSTISSREQRRFM